MKTKTGTPALPELAEQMLSLLGVGERTFVYIENVQIEGVQDFAIAVERDKERRRLAVGRRDRLPTPDEVETISEAFGLVEVAWDRMATGKSMYKCMECRWREIEKVTV